MWLRGAAHAPIHTNAYYSNVNAVLMKYNWSVPRPAAELIEDLDRIGRLLQKVQLPL